MLISYRVLFSTILSAPIMQFCIKDVLSGRENLFVFLYKTNQIDHETVLSFHGRIDWYRSSGRPLQTHCQLSFVVTRSLIGFFKIILLYLSLPSFGKAYILRKCFSPSLAVKLDNLQSQNKGLVVWHSARLLILDWWASCALCTPYQAGVEYDSIFLFCVCSERSARL